MISSKADVGLGFSVLVVVEPKILCLCGSESPIAVEVDEERVKELANGARCVSLSFLVSFHDMMRRRRQLLVQGGRLLC